eukprot:scaffold149932_cov35-Attheya_sp.AAC.1
MSRRKGRGQLDLKKIKGGWVRCLRLRAKSSKAVEEEAKVRIRKNHLAIVHESENVRNTTMTVISTVARLSSFFGTRT